MNCNKCKAELQENQKFCSECGEKVILSKLTDNVIDKTIYKSKETIKSVGKEIEESKTINSKINKRIIGYIIFPIGAILLYAFGDQYVYIQSEIDHIIELNPKNYDTGMTRDWIYNLNNTKSESLIAIGIVLAIWIAWLFWNPKN